MKKKHGTINKLSLDTKMKTLNMVKNRRNQETSWKAIAVNHVQDDARLVARKR